MTAGSALRELGGVLDDIERTAAVRHVELVEVTVGSGAGGLTAEVELTVSTGPTDAAATDVETETEGGPDADTAVLRPATTVDADGRLRLTFETVDPLVPATDGVTIEPVGVSPAGDGRLVVTLSVVVSTDRDTATDGTRETATRAREPNPGRGESAVDIDIDTDTSGERSGTRTPTDADATDQGADSGRSDRGGEGEAAGHRSVRSDQSVPPFRDTELLAEVYATHETFAEMAAALDMDVTGETVRRYMIDAGVHQPVSYNTGDSSGADTIDDDASNAEGPANDPDRDGSADGSEPPDSADADTDADADGSPVVLADGIGLPNDITVETLVEAVKRSNTVHEVERAVGVDHDEALELLRELNLLDLVVGRLATEAERDISREEVVERLREASATR